MTKEGSIKMLSMKEKTLIGMMASIGISEATTILATTLNESQMDELVKYLEDKHKEGKDATEEEVIKAYLVLTRNESES